MSGTLTGPNLAIAGCEFERVDGNPDVAVGVALGCNACRGLYQGDGVVMVNEDGFTDVVAGRCVRYAITAKSSVEV